MRRWKQRALKAEAHAAAMECAGEQTADTIYEMVKDAEAQADRYHEALEQIRDMDHGHPRTAAGAKRSSGQCPVCCVITEAGV